jgi:hypothetical protein
MGHKNRVLIGTFTAITFLDGSSFYEFDWADCNGISNCTSSNARHYSGPIEFDNAIVYVLATSSSSGPINTGQYLGEAWFTSPYEVDPLAACPNNGCTNVLLQLVSSGQTNTFTLLDGKSFTAYGVENTFILPYLGKQFLTNVCNSLGFCSGQTVPVFMHRVPNSSQ